MTGRLRIVRDARVASWTGTQRAAAIAVGCVVLGIALGLVAGWLLA